MQMHMQSVKVYLVKKQHLKAYVKRVKLLNIIHFYFFILQDHAILKPPSSKSLPTPWHQDEAYWDPTLTYESLGVWVALQPVTVENGCMQFIAGSHRTSDVLPHHTQNNNPRIHGLEVDNPSMNIRKKYCFMSSSKWWSNFSSLPNFTLYRSKSFK